MSAFNSQVDCIVGSSPTHGANFGRVAQQQERTGLSCAVGGSSPPSPTNFDQVPEWDRRRVSSDKHRMNVIPMESQTQPKEVVSYNHENKVGGSTPSLVALSDGETAKCVGENTSKVSSVVGCNSEAFRLATGIQLENVVRIHAPSPFL